MKLIEYKGYFIREGTMDDYVVNEVQSYRHMPILLGDTVLDIGANIGSFSKYATERGAKVVAVEPDPDNCYVWKMNMEPGSALIQAAVVPHDHFGHIKLYKNLGINKGLHSTVPTRGREEIMVESIPFAMLLHDFKPNKIKIDCEGAEYSFFDPRVLPNFVEWVIIEYNLSRKTERPLAKSMHISFIEAGFVAVKNPTFDTKAWATLACYKRSDK